LLVDGELLIITEDDIIANEVEEPEEEDKFEDTFDMDVENESSDDEA
jgi:hypothetical protein